MASSASLELIIRLKDQASKELAGMADKVREVGAAAKQADAQLSAGGGGLSRLGDVAKVAAVALTAVGVAGIAVGASMVKSNAQFEQYTAQFSVMLGSADAAATRMQELATFAASTPFELPGLIEGDRVLQNFGIHSQEMLTTVGDAAAGAGVSFQEMAGLIGRFSAGATGEAISRFQELGVTTRKELAGLGLQFSKSGELLSPLPQAMGVLTGAMQKHYAGLMNAQSQTFNGMLSNLQDWIGGASRELGKPIFDVLKVQLGELLAYLNKPETKAALESLAKSMAEGLKTAVPAIVAGFKTLVTNVGAFIEMVKPAAVFLADNLVPVLAAAAAGMVTFAVASVATAAPAILAAAAAFAALAIPVALVGAAVFGVAKAWQDYEQQQKKALDGVLASRKWWTDSEQALKAYGEQAGYAQTATKSQADALKQLTGAQKADLDSLAERMKWGLVSDDQYRAEMAAINARIPAIQAATAALKQDSAAVTESALRATDAIEAAREHRGALAAVGTQAVMSAEQIAQFTDALAKNATAMGGAFAQLASGGAAFISKITSLAAAHSAALASIASESAAQFGAINAARAKIMADAGKTFGKIESDLGSKLSDIAKATGDKLADINKATGQKLADIAKATGQKLAGIDVDLSSKLGDINTQLGSKLGDIAKQTGAKLAEINKATGAKIADINKASAERLAAIDRKAIDERTTAYTALQRAIATSMADMVAAQEANDLDLAGATGDRLAELRRRETTEAASRQRLAAAALAAQQRAANGEAVIAGKVFAIQQDTLAKRASLDEAYAKRQAELAGDPAALAELKRQYDEAVAAQQAAESQRVAIAEAEQRQKAAERDQERADVRAAQAEQIAATKQAAGEQIAATRQAAAESRADAEKQAAAARQQAQADAAQKRADTLAQAAEQRAAAQQQAAEQKQQALKQAAEQQQAAQIQAQQQRQAAAEQLAEQKRGNDQQMAAAAQARTDKLAAEQASYAAERQAAAQAYAEQAGAQRQHLGEMLLERVEIMRKEGVLTGAAAKELAAKLTTEYGVAKDSAVAMATAASLALEEYARSGSTNANTVIAKLGGIERNAVAAQRAAEGLAGQYTVAVVDNFAATNQTVDKLREALERIPAKVRTEIEIAAKFPVFAPGPRRNGGEAGDDSVLPRRAKGGPVAAGRRYLVGEQGQELFVPDVDGYILSAGDTRAAERAAAQLGAMPKLPERPGYRMGAGAGVEVPQQLPSYQIPEQLPQGRPSPSDTRYTGGAGRAISAPITISLTISEPRLAYDADVAALGAKIEAKVHDVFAEAIDRVIGRDL